MFSNIRLEPLNSDDVALLMDLIDEKERDYRFKLSNGKDCDGRVEQAIGALTVTREKLVSILISMSVRKFINPLRY